MMNCASRSVNVPWQTSCLSAPSVASLALAPTRCAGNGPTWVRGGQVFPTVQARGSADREGVRPAQGRRDGLPHSG